MQELLKAIKQVRERIERYRDQLRQNEMLTRYVLIDPILRALGWDTEDPEQVVPEFSTEVGRPDYVLKCYGQLVGVEAKKLDASNSDFENARRQALPLYQEKSIRFYVITDGNRWVIWDISRPKEEAPHPIIDVRLSDENCGDAARKLLALWKEAMPKVEIAPRPIVTPPIIEPAQRITLSELQQMDVAGQKLFGRLHFPDGTMKEVKRWKDLLVEVARWALSKLQQQEKLPLKNLIKRSPENMLTPRKLNGWFVETKFSANYCIRNSIRILRKASVDPSSVFIEGWQPSERKRKRS